MKYGTIVAVICGLIPCFVNALGVQSPGIPTLTCLANQVSSTGKILEPLFHYVEGNNSLACVRYNYVCYKDDGYCSANDIANKTVKTVYTVMSQANCLTFLASSLAPNGVATTTPTFGANSDTGAPSTTPNPTLESGLHGVFCCRTNKCNAPDAGQSNLNYRAVPFNRAQKAQSLTPFALVALLALVHFVF